MACTNSFGLSSSSPKPAGRKEPGAAEAEPSPSQTQSPDHEGDPIPKPVDKKSGGAPRVGGHVDTKNVPEGMDKADLAAVSMYPPPRLGQFYDFFSFSHLTPPVHCEFILSLTIPNVFGNDLEASVCLGFFFLGIMFLFVCTCG